MQQMKQLSMAIMTNRSDFTIVFNTQHIRQIIFLVCEYFPIFAINPEIQIVFINLIGPRTSQVMCL